MAISAINLILSFCIEFILNIIEREATEYRDYIDVEVKYQLRDLDTFINPNISEKDNKHIGRFRSTRFDENEWKRVISMTKERNLKPLVTVFDENSVDFAKELGVKNIKVASCSAQEWVLLEKILKASPDKVTISTGGKTLEQIDKIYSFFMSRDYTSIELMHCCAIYPAPLDAIALSNIEVLKRRYPNIKIGYSGHETESERYIGQMVIGMGSRSIERHVGSRGSKNDIPLNDYSIEVKNLGGYFNALKMAVQTVGNSKHERWSRHDLEEIKGLEKLSRGYICKKIWNQIQF